ncbi:hypothetical protein PHMEG_00013801, partial [Phytophthora megakarya]
MKWSESKLILETFDDYYKKFLCTHEWEPGSRSKGSQTGHKKRGTCCSVVLCATVLRCTDTKTFRICVMKHVRTHNLKVNKSTYEYYPSNRKVDDPKVLVIVDEMIKAPAKPKMILNYLRETTGPACATKGRGSGTVDDRLETVLRRFFSQRDTAATIFVGDKRVTQTITLQSRQMGRFFEAFPAAVMIDVTHGTNALKYNVFSFMIDDTFGHGQYVQHALVENESQACMHDDIQAFKGKNPSWDIWVVYERGHVANLGNHINNRLESAWGNLKEVLRPEMKLDEGVETFITCSQLQNLNMHRGSTSLVHVTTMVNRPDEDETGDDVSCSAFRVLALHLRSSKHSVLNGSTKWTIGMDIPQRVVKTMSSQGTSTFLGLTKALPDKDASRELNSDDQDLQSNDKSTVSTTITTEKEAEDCMISGVEEVNISDDSTDLSYADPNVSSDSAKKDSSLEDQLVTNTHPLVKSTNPSVKKDNRLVKKDNRLVKSTNPSVKKDNRLVKKDNRL